MDSPEWQWNEMQQVGTDYADVAEVEAYDRRMATFRDVDCENRSVLAALSLAPGSSVLEIGCGTGRFARMAAAQGHAVTAADVSKAMLDYVAARAEKEGLRIDVQHAGFLTLPLAPEGYDAVVSVAALHHLPDVWKAVALRRIHRGLKPGGQFILRDVVFAPADDDFDGCFARFVNSFDESMRSGAAGHVAAEYSTLDWIMAGLLKRAGFTILSARQEGESFTAYHCRKDTPAGGLSK
ncbi:MAG: class I SAM-dependent methyltransferase [Sedimentisphaerales bacterium]|nr:class I SAM-dependent methyltransferase [Sedimentisphaerales bacterium]